MTVLSLPLATKIAAIREYFTRVYPARGHGATDCGEYLDGTGHLPDAEHFVSWMRKRGHHV